MLCHTMFFSYCGQLLYSVLFCQQSCRPHICKQKIKLIYHIFRTCRICDRCRRSYGTCGACRAGRAVYLCTTLDFPLCWVGKPLDCLVFNHSDNVVIILDVINNSLVLVGKIEVNRYFPVLMHPNRFYEFNHNPAVKALNVFVFQKGG